MNAYIYKIIREKQTAYGKGKHKIRMFLTILLRYFYKKENQIERNP